MPMSESKSYLADSKLLLEYPTGLSVPSGGMHVNMGGENGPPGLAASVERLAR